MSQWMHAGIPAELQLAARADELLDRQFLAARAREVIASYCDTPRILRSEASSSMARGR
jgi:hypothetical protein